MNNAVISLSLPQLALAFLPVVITLAILVKWSMSAGNALYALARMLVQLLLIGYVLAWIFGAESGWLILIVLAIMILASSWIALRTVPEQRWKLLSASFASIALGGGFPLLVISQVVLQLEPWYLPRYLIPLAGMVFANSMTAVSLAAERLYAEMGHGANWEKAHEDYIDGLYSSYGYYFGVIRVAPYDDSKVYIMGVPFLKSDDNGKNWESIGGQNMHSDHQALWVSGNTKGLLIGGNDGGLNTSFDDGKSWTKQNTIPVGQFYSVNVDNAKNYNVYGGLQDNGVWTGPHTYEYSTRWQGRGQYPYKGIYGGDGMQVVVDTRDNNTVYTGLQFGNYARINKKTGASSSIKPGHELGDSPLRFNWQSPIHLSKHNQDVVYFGSNKFHRSLNQGEDWDITSADLTKGGKKGNVPYGTLSSIDESPLQFGLIYVGSDDGLVHVSKDGGNTWKNISSGLIPDQWVSRVEASNFNKDRVYVALNGYRWDKFDAMIYKSDDGGTTWQRIGTDLPMDPVNVIKEDPFNENLLYVGTDHGLYISLDQGKTFMNMDNKLPHVPVHDLVIQQKAKDLVIGTHGRSIYRVNVKELEKLNEKIMAKPIHMFSVDDANLASSLSIFPVPASELVTVSMGDFEFEKGTMEIYSMLGQMVHNQKINDKSSIIDISKLSTGVYLLNVSTENGFATTKIVKK